MVRSDVNNDLLWLLLVWLLRPAATTDGHVLVVRRNLWFLDVEMVERITVGSPQWRAWLERNERFTYDGPEGRCLLQKELVKGHPYWRAYKWHTRRLKSDKIYVGKLPDLPPEVLRAKVKTLCDLAKERRARHLAERARLRRGILAGRRRRRRERQRLMSSARRSVRTDDTFLFS